MKICKRCGSSIDDSAIFCQVCGERQGVSASPFGSSGRRNDYSPGTVGSTEGNIWIALLSFLVPVVGLVLWYSWRFTKPAHAASAAKGALVGVCLNSPIVGLVAWLILRESHRDLAKVAGIAAIVGVALSVLFSVVAFVLTALDVTLFGYTMPEILEFFYYMS